jgi:hypothetical protein
MSMHSLPDAETVVRTAKTYAKDLTERTLATFVVGASGVAIAAGPGDMFSASFWESVAAGGIIAAGSLLKGLAARVVGSKNSASTVKGV